MQSFLPMRILSRCVWKYSTKTVGTIEGIKFGVETCKFSTPYMIVMSGVYICLLWGFVWTACQVMTGVCFLYTGFHYVC
jgi:hypothetical protein